MTTIISQIMDDANDCGAPFTLRIHLINGSVIPDFSVLRVTDEVVTGEYIDGLRGKCATYVAIPHIASVIVNWI